MGEKVTNMPYNDRTIPMSIKGLDERVTHLEEKAETMEEKNPYFNQYLDQRFKNIESTTNRIESKLDKMDTKLEDLQKDNWATRKWVASTGFAIIFGISAILFAFAKLQTSWMQNVISFAAKALKIP